MTDGAKRQWLAELKRRLNDPWRVLRHIENGIDPVVIKAETGAIDRAIDELEAELADADTR